MFHAETSAPSALDLPNLISLSTIESPLTPDGDCVAGYRGSDTEKALDPRRGAPEPSAVTSRASQKRCVCFCAFRSRVRLGAVPRHGTNPVLSIKPCTATSSPYVAPSNRQMARGAPRGRTPLRKGASLLHLEMQVQSHPTLKQGMASARRHAALLGCS